jgi:anti-sigma regulatory factor (Ser/Thr protein kinase)
MFRRQVRIHVTEQSQPAAARRAAVELAQKVGLDESDVAGVALVVTELATNLVKHATQGQLLIRPLGPEGNEGMEVLSLDKGPGIPDVGRALADGFSTAGSPGTGLGAVRRMARHFDLYSQPGTGTAIMARIQPRHLQNSMQRLPSVGVICQAKEGETLCGDDWLVQCFADGWLCAVVDGLGHGMVAAEAAAPIIEAVKTAGGTKTPVEVIEAAHHAARATRGAALGVAVLDAEAHILRFAGIGNIAGIVVERERCRHLVSYNGIVGEQYRKLAEFTHPWSKEAILVLHSDGIGTQWDLFTYPGLLSRHPSLIAAVLFRDFARERDDATIVVIKEG